MLAGWMTLEARLATAFLLLLVLAAGVLPSRHPVQFQIAVELTAHPDASPQVAERPGGAPQNRLGMRASVGDTPSVSQAEDVGGGRELGLLNQDRLQAGVPPLAESASLDGIAAIRATQLVSDGITHVRPGHSKLAAVELMQARGIPYGWHGENIIWEGGMPLVQVPGFFNDWWMASLAHRDNILNPNYRSVGIGVARSGDRVYMVEVFTDQAPPHPPSLAPLHSREGGSRRY